MNFTKLLLEISPQKQQPLDRTKIPPLFNKTIDSFLKPMNPSSNEDYLLLILLVLSSFLLCFQRVKIKRHEHDNNYMNMYGITFLLSGGYKDKPFNEMRKFIIDFLLLELEIREESYIATRKSELEEMADKMFKKTANGNRSASAEKYIREKMPRKLNMFFKNATVEGLSALRAAYMQSGFGTPFLIIEEFADYLKAMSGDKYEMLSFIGELWNYGDHESKVTKGDATTESVHGVPQMALMHSSFKGVLEDESVHKLLTERIARQLGRRCFFVFEEKGEKVDHSEITSDMINERVKRETDARLNSPNIRKEFKDIFDYFYSDTDMGGTKEILVSPEANELYTAYDMWCKQRSEDAPSGIAEELTGRPFKTLKLSGILAAYTNKEDGCTDANMKDAIYLTEYYGDHFRRLVLKRSLTFAESVFNFIRKSNGKYVTTTTISEQGFCSGREFSMMMRNNMSLIEEYIETNALILEIESHGRNGKKYRIITKKEKIKENLKTYESLIK